MSGFDHPFQVGLRPPETAQDTEKRATIEGMRLAIQQGRRDSALISAALESAYWNGLSGEDTYVMLAYHALMALETYAQRCSEMLALQPFPPLIMKSKR